MDDSGIWERGEVEYVNGDGVEEVKEDIFCGVLLYFQMMNETEYSKSKIEFSGKNGKKVIGF